MEALNPTASRVLDFICAIERGNRGELPLPSFTSDELAGALGLDRWSLFQALTTLMDRRAIRMRVYPEGYFTLCLRQPPALPATCAPARVAASSA